MSSTTTWKGQRATTATSRPCLPLSQRYVPGATSPLMTTRAHIWTRFAKSSACGASSVLGSNYALKGTLRTSREFPGYDVGAGPLNAALGNFLMVSVVFRPNARDAVRVAVHSHPLGSAFALMLLFGVPWLGALAGLYARSTGYDVSPWHIVGLLVLPLVAVASGTAVGAAVIVALGRAPRVFAGERRCEFGEAGIQSVHAGRSARLAWDNITGFPLRPGGLFVFANKRVRLFIPARALAPATQRELLELFARNGLKSV